MSSRPFPPGLLDACARDWPYERSSCLHRLASAAHFHCLAVLPGPPIPGPDLNSYLHEHLSHGLGAPTELITDLGQGEPAPIEGAGQVELFRRELLVSAGYSTSLEDP